MNWQTREIAPGLYLVATPLGNARDITLRVLDILASADVLAAEDTRSLRRLMEIHGVALGDRPVVAYHDHNGDKARPKLMAALDAGQSVVYASEAGTPLISDPGFDLMRAALEAGVPCTTAPGPTAAVAALTLSGLPSDRFLFAGFLSNSASKRKSALAELASVPATLILYESPKRLGALLRDAAEILGADRQAVVCRELTKKFEERCAGTLAELAETYDEPPKGEIVVVIDRGGAAMQADQATLDDALRDALGRLSVKDAASEVSKIYGIPRREAYQRAMALGKN
ncbi:16S rRNA (cytidine(1402)-2'-O)-methyltransferase [Marivita sp. XM-24bin2]|jgi:16S rRNA (cytidine1402-2'-O)-methyltransferase|uniref:16S rRNA (cytidine(1402)-2'-O)-methyltransferase n=1 Tax=unclassified Marivita TaxID=2632480 RepID=UPI000D7B027C|nr:16S rRNA (cytidine(1402)-2'-O)-methyltransferase [Marivita sp. XM-24bin2]MCR9110001.1 16S rRNA (cytidine(1402)-2'-O)-methyltransferase [Paracoccaceae bacterium]PWL35596.1 MAG: 16S rRNA (cytidine(1402)-2'-O)-methyltransferase [Marivita sp. XM-24bin2]